MNFSFANIAAAQILEYKSNTLRLLVNGEHVILIRTTNGRATFFLPIYKVGLHNNFDEIKPKRIATFRWFDKWAKDPVVLLAQVVDTLLRHTERSDALMDYFSLVVCRSGDFKGNCVAQINEASTEEVFVSGCDTNRQRLRVRVTADPVAVAALSRVHTRNWHGGINDYRSSARLTVPVYKDLSAHEQIEFLHGEEIDRRLARVRASFAECVPLT